MFRYRIAEQGSADFDVWLRLRTDLYLETGLIQPDELDSTGLYVDAYDSHSVHVLASDDSGADMGCTRLIDGSDGAPLQVTDLFDTTPLSRSSEASGTAVAAPYRKSWVSLGLYRALFEIAVDRWHEHRYSIVEPPYLANLRALGYPYEVIGEPLNVFGHPYLACVYALADLLPSMATAVGPSASLVHRYFSRPFQWAVTEEDVLEPSRWPDADCSVRHCAGCRRSPGATGASPRCRHGCRPPARRRQTGRRSRRDFFRRLALVPTRSRPTCRPRA